MVTLFSVRDRVIVSVKWISNTDVLVDAEPVPPNQLLIYYISKPPPPFTRLIGSVPTSPAHWKQDDSVHPSNLSRLPHYVETYLCPFVTVCWFNVLFLCIFSPHLPLCSCVEMQFTASLGGSQIEQLAGQCPVRSIGHAVRRWFSNGTPGWLSCTIHRSCITKQFFYRVKNLKPDR